MVVFDFIICDGLSGCPAVSGEAFWYLMTSIVDALIVLAALLLFTGYNYKLLMWIAINFSVNVTIKTPLGVARQFANCGCGPAMPSGHVQMISGLLILFFYMDWHWSHHRPLYIAWHYSTAIAGVTLIAISRVVLGFHTIPQVLVAVPVGMAVGGIGVLVEALLIPSLCPVFRMFPPVRMKKKKKEREMDKDEKSKV